MEEVQGPEGSAQGKFSETPPHHDLCPFLPLSFSLLSEMSKSMRQPYEVSKVYHTNQRIQQFQYPLDKLTPLPHSVFATIYCHDMAIWICILYVNYMRDMKVARNVTTPTATVVKVTIVLTQQQLCTEHLRAYAHIVANTDPTSHASPASKHLSQSASFHNPPPLKVTHHVSQTHKLS